MRLTHFRNLTTTLLVAAALVFGVTGCQTAPREAAPEQIVFVCEHGSVKSLIAASLFERAAAQRGLRVHALSRGMTPDERVPPKIVAALSKDGFDVEDYRPQALAPRDLAAAVRIVAIGVDVSTHDGATRAPIQSWNDVPAASVDYEAARAALARHIDALLTELENVGY